MDTEEECDDGNRLNNDGCDWLCGDETGTLVLGTQIDFGEDPSLNFPNVPIPNSLLQHLRTNRDPHQRTSLSIQTINNYRISFPLHSCNRLYKHKGLQEILALQPLQ